MGSWGELYHIPLCPLPHPYLKDVIMPHHHCIQATPQVSRGVKPEPSTPVAEGSGLAQQASSLAVSQALEVAIPTHMTPLCLNVGGIKRVYKCWVEGCSEGPSTSQAAICAHVHCDHLRVRLACPSCNQTFLNLDALRHHMKIHSSKPQ